MQGLWDRLILKLGFGFLSKLRGIRSRITFSPSLKPASRPNSTEFGLRSVRSGFLIPPPFSMKKHVLAHVVSAKIKTQEASCVFILAETTCASTCFFIEKGGGIKKPERTERSPNSVEFGREAGLSDGENVIRDRIPRSFERNPKPSFSINLSHRPCM